jgi:hypothetical protein
MSNNKYMRVVSTPVDFTLYIVPEQKETENYSILKYVYSFLSFNSFAGGYRF